MDNTTGILHLTQPDLIIPFPDFIFGEMAQRGCCSIEAELPCTDSVCQSPVRWEIRRDGGEIEAIAETRPSHFRTILARFAKVCGVSPYGGETSLSIDAPFSGALGTYRYTVILRNSQHLGFGIRIFLHAIDDRLNPSGSSCGKNRI